MKLTTGILITILMAGSAMGQQASTPSFWDTLRAKVMGAPAPKPTAQHPANPQPNAAKPATATNVKPSPAQGPTQAQMQTQPKNGIAGASVAKTQTQSIQVQPAQANVSKSATPVPAKNSAPQTAQAKPASAPATKAPTVPVVAAKAPESKAPSANLKNADLKNADLKKEVLQKVAANAKADDAKAADGKPKAEDSKSADAKSQVAVEDSKTAANTKSATKEFNYTGQRDPFISPVRTAATGGSGCSTGKRCLAIDQINLKGVIKSDGGMIAVVTNSMDKAYFLRENDPVFNGYVVKITGDSVIFSETYEDKLGKPLTREVTKKLLTPAV